MGSGHGFALPMAQSWAPCHVHTPTHPSRLGKCFASGVTTVPERPELLCQHLASTTRVGGDPSEVPGQGGWGTTVARARGPGRLSV